MPMVPINTLQMRIAITAHVKEMALNLLSFSLSPPCSPTRLPLRSGPPSAQTNIHVARHISCAAATDMVQPTIIRRNANYQPPVLDYDFVQSLKSDYTDDECVRGIERLAEESRCLLRETTDSFTLLELIGVLQRLGLAYLFESEIKEALDAISNDENDKEMKDLNVTALRFRLLRQHGYKVSQDVFNSFMDETGSFKACLSQDIEGMLSLYEASHLGFIGETVLDVAKAFTTKHLKGIKGNIEPNLAKQVTHALELPMHYMEPRLEARWYIEEVYEKEKHMKPFLLELAKLDYNRVQAFHQSNVRDMARWWKDLGTMEVLPFTRDRVVECFLFSLGISFKPQYQYFRDVVTQVNQILTMIDDVYDVYGSLDELELFTDAVQRWTTDAIEKLPEYMKICYMVLFNNVNALAYDALKEQGVDVLPCLKKMWGDLCKTYITEARWYYSGHTSPFKEYLDNGWISVGAPIILAHGYFSMRLKITKEVLEGLENYHNLVIFPSIILRLCDDVGTSTYELARGDVPKAVECYMHETGASEVAAREHVRVVIDETWKKLNEECLSCSPFPRAFINGCVGLGRISECMYQFGDGFGRPHEETKGRVTVLLVEPIPLKKI